MAANWFIAWPASPLAGFEALFEGAPEGIRRFHPADLHLTVAFLGPVGEARALAAWEVACAAPASPVTIRLGPLEPFGPRRHPSAYAFEVQTGRRALVEWMRRHQAAIVDAAGAPPAIHEPRPHLTIARPPRQADASVRARIEAWARQVRPPAEPMVLDRIALYTWAADRSVRLFQEMRSRDLRAG
ncbi:MAG: 2'-5' RNA ligase family protein [Rhodothermales bacterium]